RLLAAIAGHPVRWRARARTGGPTAAARLGEDEAAAQDRARRYKEAQNDPVIKELLARFEADIVAREPATRQEWEERL
nr:hypothetical protein [Planctomycetota bacterium]